MQLFSTLSICALAVFAIPTEQNFIRGSLWFYNDCDDVMETQYRTDINVGEKIKPSGATQLKKLHWNYPHNGYNLDFYLDESSKTPYATITGRNWTTFVDTICGLNEKDPRYLIINADHSIIGDSQSLFVKDTSYAIASYSGLTPDQHQ
ncbi:hypothetical protein BC833DRAFT_653988 [Globomyces pollinis-pini]|nr:hypothetical protein BC833DRAFT_653988 [Globomyces pollinis-pini]